MAVQKKIPVRQCMGCNAHKPKKELLRVVHTPEGTVELDFTGKRSGRGAYICRSADCLRKARKNRRLESNLGVSIPPEVYDDMERTLSEAESHDDP